MYFYALTYTDPSEPWGHAVLDGKLYRTPTALVDAWNAHFDAWRIEQIGVWHNRECSCPVLTFEAIMEDPFAARIPCDCTGHYEYMSRVEAMQRDMALMSGNYEGMTLDEALLDDYTREYGVARYQVVA